MTDTVEPIGRLMTKAVGAFIEEMHHRLGDLGYPELRPVHGFVFQALGDAGATTAEIGGRLGMSKQGAAKVVALMADLGYVRTVVDPDDARARPVVVTARGREAMTAAAAIQGRLETELARSLGRADVDATRRVMAAMQRRWGADGATSRRPLP